MYGPLSLAFHYVEYTDNEVITLPSRISFIRGIEDEKLARRIHEAAAQRIAMHRLT